MGAGLKLSQLDSTGGVIGTHSTLSTATSTTFSQLTLTGLTGTSGLGTLQFEPILSGGTGTGTAQFDGAILVEATSLPTAWASGREVRNHFDDDGQLHINYLDLYDIPGDVPAAIQIKATENEAHTDFWVGARHDERQTDSSIFIEGEDFTSTIGTGWTVQANAGFSNGSYGRHNPVSNTLGDVTSTSPGSPQVLMSVISAPPPKGLYRVLVRWALLYATSTVFLAPSYQYGDITEDPSGTNDYISGTGTGQRASDMGVITIPPIETPAGGTVGTFGLRIAYYLSSMTANTPVIDYVILMPVDEGFGYASKTSAADIVMVDSRSPLKALYILDSSDVVQSIPADQVGSPPEAHPKGSRYYLTSDDGTADIDDGWTVSVTYEPRFLQVD